MAEKEMQPYATHLLSLGQQFRRTLLEAKRRREAEEEEEEEELVEVESEGGGVGGGGASGSDGRRDAPSPPCIPVRHRHRRARADREDDVHEEAASRGEVHPGVLILSRLRRLIRARNLQREDVPAQRGLDDGENVEVPAPGAAPAPAPELQHYNPPPNGKEVQSIEQLSRVPNSYYVLTVLGLRLAVTLEDTQNGLQEFGMYTASFRVILMSSNDSVQAGMEMWNGSLMSVLARILDETVQR
jgi:hypothetical protein